MVLAAAAPKTKGYYTHPRHSHTPNSGLRNIRHHFFAGSSATFIAAPSIAQTSSRLTVAPSDVEPLPFSICASEVSADIHLITRHFFIHTYRKITNDKNKISNGYFIRHPAATDFVKQTKPSGTASTSLINWGITDANDHVTAITLLETLYRPTFTDHAFYSQIISNVI